MHLLMRETIFAEAKPPLRDDILKMLLPALEPNTILRRHQEKNTARNRKFKQFFAEYIIEIVCFGLNVEDK